MGLPTIGDLVIEGLRGLPSLAATAYFQGARCAGVASTEAIQAYQQGLDHCPDACPAVSGTVDVGHTITFEVKFILVVGCSLGSVAVFLAGRFTAPRKTVIRYGATKGYAEH